MTRPSAAPTARAYAGEPFVRIVAHRQGAHRLPDPKILLGSNHCDVGFAADGDRLTVIAALDNLMKGGSGNAVQCLNIAHGLARTPRPGVPRPAPPLEPPGAPAAAHHPISGGDR